MRANSRTYPKTREILYDIYAQRGVAWKYLRAKIIKVQGARK